MFRTSRSERAAAALAILGISIAGYSIFTAKLDVPTESELIQIDGTPAKVASSRYQLTFLVEGTAGNRVLHYPQFAWE